MDLPTGKRKFVQNELMYKIWELMEPRRGLGSIE